LLHFHIKRCAYSLIIFTGALGSEKNELIKVLAMFSIMVNRRYPLGSKNIIMHISVKLDTDSGFNWIAFPDQNGQLITPVNRKCH
jgi:hypothetical protein